MEGGGVDSKEYGFICIICIPGCLQLHFVALVILRGLKKRFNCTYFFVELKSLSGASNLIGNGSVIHVLLSQKSKYLKYKIHILSS